LASAPLGATKLYKTTDAEGNVTYSQTPPPGTQAETIEVRVAGPGDEAAQSQLQDLTERAESASEDRRFEATAAAEIREREERIRQNCETARENQRILQSAPRVQDTDASGTPYYLDDAARQERLDKTQRQIEEFCQ